MDSAATAPRIVRVEVQAWNDHASIGRASSALLVRGGVTVANHLPSRRTAESGAQANDRVELVGHHDLQIRLLCRGLMGVLLGRRATSTVHLSLLQLLVDVLTVLANRVERFHQHAVGADLGGGRSSGCLRQVDRKVGDHKRTTQVVTGRLKIGRRLKLVQLLLLSGA